MPCLGGMAVKVYGRNLGSRACRLVYDRPLGGGTVIPVKINEMLAEKHQIPYTTITDRVYAH